MSEVVTLENGQKAPNFCMDDSDGNTHDLAALNASGKTVILYFYPRDSTPGCTVQACDFRDQMSRLNSNQFIVLGVSKDSAKSHANFIEKQQLMSIKNRFPGSWVSLVTNANINLVPNRKNENTFYAIPSLYKRQRK